MPVVCNVGSEHLEKLLDIDQAANPLPWSHTSLATEFANPHAIILGVRESGQLRGYILAHLVVDEAHIVNFAISPEYQSKGLGRFLITEALSRLDKLHCQWVTLEVRRLNHKAIGLYTSLGFFEAGIRGAYYKDTGEDALLLKLNLLDWKKS